MKQIRDDGLSQNQERTIGALLDTTTFGDAAVLAGISPKTLRAWLKDPDFAAAYTEAKQEMLRRVLDLSQRGFATGKKVLSELAETGTPGMRMKAARSLCQVGNERVALTEIQLKLERLERKIDGDGGPPGSPPGPGAEGGIVGPGESPGPGPTPAAGGLPPPAG